MKAKLEEKAKQSAEQRAERVKKKYFAMFLLPPLFLTFN
jgi:hypothetical protein